MTLMACPPNHSPFPPTECSQAEDQEAAYSLQISPFLPGWLCSSNQIMGSSWQGHDGFPPLLDIGAFVSLHFMQYLSSRQLKAFAESYVMENNSARWQTGQGQNTENKFLMCMHSSPVEAHLCWGNDIYGTIR